MTLIKSWTKFHERQRTLERLVDYRQLLISLSTILVSEHVCEPHVCGMKGVN